MSLKALVLGCGQIGSTYDDPDSQNITTHAHAFSIHPEFELVGLIDTNKDIVTKQAKKWSTQGFTQLEEALEKVKPDIISICTPNETHKELILKCSKLPLKAIVCEKPISLTREEEKEVLDTGIVIYINYIRRFLPEIINLKNKIATGEFGEFIKATGHYCKGIEHNGTHLIDLLNYLFMPKNPSLKLLNKPKLNEYDFTYSFDDKTVYVQNLTQANYTSLELDLFFENSRIQILDSGRKVSISSPVESQDYKGYKYLNSNEVIETDLNKYMHHCINKLFQSLQGGPNISSLSNALQVSRIIENELK